MARTGPSPQPSMHPRASPALCERLHDAGINKISPLTIFCANLPNNRPLHAMMLWRSARPVIDSASSEIAPVSMAHRLHFVLSRGPAVVVPGAKRQSRGGLATMVRASSAKRPAFSSMRARSRGGVAARAVGDGSAALLVCTQSIKMSECRRARKIVARRTRCQKKQPNHQVARWLRRCRSANSFHDFFILRPRGHWLTTNNQRGEG
jgi:hypothetical protein